MRRQKNRVTRLVRVGRSICEDQAELENMSINFYEHLHASEGVVGIEEVSSHVPCKVTDAMNEILDAPYTEKEVKAALFQMFLTKSPGPDGFLAHFF